MYSWATAPWDEERPFSSKREKHVKKEILPELEMYVDYACIGRYSEDKSLYEVYIDWSDYGTNRKNGSIQVLWAPEQEHQFLEFYGMYDSEGNL